MRTRIRRGCGCTDSPAGRTPSGCTSRRFRFQTTNPSWKRLSKLSSEANRHESGELSRLRRDGTIGYQSFSASPVVDGDRVIGVEGFMIDITERKKIQALYELISENAADVIWIWDLEEGRCVYVSPSVEQLRGFSPEEILAQPLDQAMPGDGYRRAVAEIESRRTAVEAGERGRAHPANEVVYICKTAQP